MTNKTNPNSSTKRLLLLIGLSLHRALPQPTQIIIEAASYLYQLSQLLTASLQLHVCVTGISPNATVTFSQKSNSNVVQQSMGFNSGKLQ